MLCVISYDLKGADKDHQALCDKIESLGSSCRCNASTVLLHTEIDAGLVDAAIRSVVDEEASFFVVDITGVDEERYFGRVPARVPGETFWQWLRANNN